MSQMMTFAGVPIVIAMSVAIAIGVEVLLIGSFLRMMGRAAAQLEESPSTTRKNSAR